MQSGDDEIADLPRRGRSCANIHRCGSGFSEQPLTLCNGWRARERVCVEAHVSKDDPDNCWVVDCCSVHPMSSCHRIVESDEVGGVSLADQLGEAENVPGVRGPGRPDECLSPGLAFGRDVVEDLIESAAWPTCSSFQRNIRVEFEAANRDSVQPDPSGLDLRSQPRRLRPRRVRPRADVVVPDRYVHV